MDEEGPALTYHVVLVGVDRYPPGYNSLAGCVNDIDAIEGVLFDPPGVGIPAERIQVTRLAAPAPGRPSTSRFQAQTLPPTRANLVQALRDLAGPAVGPSDRVLIYYSGHGDEKLWTGSSAWHEALVPHNGQDIEYLFDAEINVLINAIAARTSDLTIVLDACHSAGATRALTAVRSQGAVRSLRGSRGPVAPPDLSVLGPAALSLMVQPHQGCTTGGAAMAAHLLQTADPSYLAVVACQPDEKANEGAYPADQPAHGAFTYSLLSALGAADAGGRAALRWADIWPALLAQVAERNTQLGQQAQHPWLIGRSERRVFGGSWEPMDPGYQVTLRPDGVYEVGAGSLMGVTEGAEIAVYGPEPRLFPVLGSPDDRPAGRLAVQSAGPSSALAAPAGAAFALPADARGRLVVPGASRRLRASLDPQDDALQAYLAASPLLEILPPAAPGADVEVIARPEGGWSIGNDTEPLLAAVPPGARGALRAGLEQYYRYHTVLQMARSCNDPQLSSSLSLRLLDCNDQDALAALAPEKLADPDLPEAPRDQDRVYALPSGFKFAVRLANSSPYDLYLTLFDCSAGGLVQSLGDTVLRARAVAVIWFGGTLGAPFFAGPDQLPPAHAGIQVAAFVTDRMLALATTRPGVDLRALGVDKTVQQVVAENAPGKGFAAKGLRPAAVPAAPAELWTASLTPVRIMKS